MLTAGFLLPPALKARWTAVAFDPIATTTSIRAAAGLAAYAAAALRLIRRRRSELADQRSDDARYGAAWLSRALGATLLLLPVWTVYALWDAVGPLGYVRLMGLYAAIAAVTLYLGVEGGRHATVPFPIPSPRPAPSAASPARDWRAQGEAWAAKVRDGDSAREPELTLAALAQRLGTNTGYLSRALNEDWASASRIRERAAQRGRRRGAGREATAVICSRSRSTPASPPRPASTAPSASATDRAQAPTVGAAHIAKSRRRHVILRRAPRAGRPFGRHEPTPRARHARRRWGCDGRPAPERGRGERRRGGGPPRARAAPGPVPLRHAGEGGGAPRAPAPTTPKHRRSRRGTSSCRAFSPRSVAGTPTATSTIRRRRSPRPFFFVRLPHSGLEFDLPLIGYFPPGSPLDGGLPPDERAPPTAAALSAGRDPALAAALAWIHA